MRYGTAFPSKFDSDTDERQPQTEQGLSVGEIGLVYASAIKAVAEQQTDALKAAREAAISK